MAFLRWLFFVKINFILKLWTTIIKSQTYCSSLIKYFLLFRYKNYKYDFIVISKKFTILEKLYIWILHNMIKK